MNRLKELLIGISDPFLRSNQSNLTQPVKNVRQKVISQKKKSKIAHFLLKGSQWLRDFNIPMREEYRKLHVKKTQWWSKDELEDLQQKYLRYLIKHAYQNVPFYHYFFRKRGLSPDDIKKKEDLVKLPIVNKKMMRDHYKWFSCPPYRLGTFKSSGSTGIPWRYHWSYLWIRMWENIIWRGWNWAGYKKGKRMASFFAEGLGRVSSAGLNIGGTITSAKLKTVIRQLKAYQPQHCYVYPNVAHIIAKYLIDHNDLSIQVESIITTGEQLFDWERKVIEEAFQCKVFNEWGSNDGANTAQECSEHIGLHHSAERNIIEIVDGRIIATDLWNYAFPFIRYENGDAGKWLNECSCGRGLPLLEVHGRFNDFIITSTDLILPSTIAGPIANLAISIDSYQIVQKSLDRIELRVIKDTHFSDIEFQNALAKMKEIVKEIDIKVKFVNKIPLTSAGKRKFIINETNIDILDYLSEF